MKKCFRIMLCMIGTMVFAGAIIWLSFSYAVNYKKTTCDRLVSPDGQYELQLLAVGEPEWPFGAAKGRLVLKNRNQKISQRDFQLRNDGARITSSCWKVTWYEDRVEVVLSGAEQLDEQVVLYFDGENDGQQMTDVNDDGATREELEESRVIQEQSFDVEMDEWGEVRFVSYLPNYDINFEDVSFLLAKNDQIVYHFPVYYENNSTESSEVGMFDSVEAVGFRDLNGDSAKDVVVIINYVTGAGPHGMLPRKKVRIFQACASGFVIFEDLMDELMENIEESELSVPAIYEYMEEKRVFAKS